MALSDKEIDQLIRKLREKYKDAAKEYKTRLFNSDAFEDRFQTALKKRMNLEGFVLSEIANFEKIKQKIEDELHPKAPVESEFSKQVNQILEENTARIAKYREIQFHPEAGMEISRLYGALSDFVIFYFSVLWIIINDNDNKNRLYMLENSLSDFAVQKNKHPRRIEDHIMMLKRGGTKEIDIEKDKNDYLKESAFLLHDISDFMDRLIGVKDKEWENPLKFDKLYAAGETRKKMLSIYNGMTPYGAILAVKEQAENILKDFRLESFRRKK